MRLGSLHALAARALLLWGATMAAKPAHADSVRVAVPNVSLDCEPLGCNLAKIGKPLNQFPSVPYDHAGSMGFVGDAI